MKPGLRIIAFTAAGWLAGEGIVRLRPSSRSAALQAAAADAAKKLPRNSWAAFLYSRGVWQGEARPSLTAEELRTSAESLEKPDGALALSERFSTAPAAEFPALLAVVAAIKDSHVRLQATEVLFAAWVEKDVMAAVNAAGTYPALAESAVQAVVRAWMEHDRPALLAWLRSRVSSGTRRAAEEPAMLHLARYYPGEALEYAVQINRWSTTGKKLFVEWRAKDQAAAEAWFAAAPEATRFELYPEWLQAQSGPLEEKWNLVLKTAPGDYRRSQGLGAVLEEWKKTDLPSAMKALAALPETAWGRELAAAAGAMFADAGTPEEEIFAVVPAKYQASFWTNLTNTRLNAPDLQHPELPARYFTYIPVDNVERQRLAPKIVVQWTSLGGGATVDEWVKSLPPDRARDLAAVALAQHYYEGSASCKADPAAAKAWVEEIQDAAIREDVLRRLSP